MSRDVFTRGVPSRQRFAEIVLEAFELLGA